MPRPLRALVALAACGALLLGCSSDDDGDAPATIAKADVEAGVTAQLMEEVPDANGEPVLDCEGDLEAEVGATTTCQLASDEDGSFAYPVQVEITAIEDGEPTYEVSFEEE